MKKIFSILLSLALLVSLGVLTTGPAAAVTQPSISPTSATYNLDAPAQVTATINWGSATNVSSIQEAGGVALTAGETNHYVVYGPPTNLLVVTSNYLSGVLTFVGDSVQLVIIFDVGTCVLTITCTGTSASVSPTSATWVFGSSASVSTTIHWGAATGAPTITDSNGYTLVPADYTIYGTAPADALLVIDNTYLKAAGTFDDVGDSITLVITFSVGIATFTITAVGPDPTINPTSKGWVLASGAYVTTTITWNSATPGSLTIKESGVALTAPPGPGNDYWLIDNLLVILPSYLATVLTSDGDTVTLVLEFSVGQCLFTITASGTLLPSVSPASTTYDLGTQKNVTTAITWGNATAITKIVDVSSLSNTVDLVAGKDYQVVGNTLQLRGSCEFWSDKPPWSMPLPVPWGGLECRLDASSRTARLLEVSFNDTAATKVIFTVTSAGYTNPSLSSTALTYNLDAKYDPAYLYTVALITFGTATNVSAVVVSSFPEAIPPYPGAWTSPGLCNITLAYGSYLAGADYYTAYVGAYASYAILIWKPTFLAQACNVTSAGANLTRLGDTIKVTLYWAPWNPVYIPATGLTPPYLPTPYDNAQYGKCPIDPYLYGYPYRYSPTSITITAVGTSASISPTKADFNLDSPADVTTTITWGPHASNVDDVKLGVDSVPAGNWTWTPIDSDTARLTIIGSYLASKLTEVDQSIALKVIFDQGDDATLTVTATGTEMCFIATAAYGTPTAEQIDIIREFRDKVLRPNTLGAKLVSLYYKTSPPIANVISQNEVLRTVVRECLIDPIVAILTWSHGLWS